MAVSRIGIPFPEALLFRHLMLDPRVTIAYGVEDLAVSVLALDRLHYASHVLPEVYVNLS